MFAKNIEERSVKKRKEKDSVIDLDAFHHERMKLHALIDSDPAKAIESARALPSAVPVKGVLYTSLKAAVLIDAGACARDKSAIEEGVDLLRKLLHKSPAEAGLHYNLGNGLMALADQEPYGLLNSSGMVCDALQSSSTLSPRWKLYASRKRKNCFRSIRHRRARPKELPGC